MPNTKKQSGVSVDLDELIQLQFQASRAKRGSKRKVMTLLSGGRLSGFRGRGMEFLETRHYQPGDDIRAIDWRVTARSNNKPHTKIFHEERERPVLVLLDQRAAMRFGSRVAFKSVQAARASALLAWSAMQNGDRVGGVVLNDDRYQDIRPAGGRRGILRLFQHMAQSTNDKATPPGGQNTTLASALLQLRRISHPGSFITIFSDFQDFDKEAQHHLGQLAQHTDVLGVFIYDSLEQQLPPPGLYAISDGKQQRWLNSADKRAREIYQNLFKQRYQALEQHFQQRGLRLTQLATHDDPATIL
ncbi:DUF58 domain-containing protein [Candidatus Venteria ishoeyi]|uniref:DUF58 domain-containing protein n=1 Tax=Candidatus Venteria ishoeyi TaxID=1899563 RepID=UPI0025A5BBEF|nr:DUF58 domain-containing protein [Candidatus Venteria ishoeyi]MDM8546656.1 DUF58 domain-containing protein [Candidatus Venteria ishoeyi]